MFNDLQQFYGVLVWEFPVFHQLQLAPITFAFLLIDRLKIQVCPRVSTLETTMKTTLYTAGVIHEQILIQHARHTLPAAYFQSASLYTRSILVQQYLFNSLVSFCTHSLLYKHQNIRLLHAIRPLYYYMCIVTRISG